MKNPAMISFEFESNDMFLALGFMKVLRKFDITPYYDSIMPTYADSSLIKFQATVKQRIMVEYVYRRLCKMDPIFISDLNGYQRNQSRFYHDGYYILGGNKYAH